MAEKSKSKLVSFGTLLIITGALSTISLWVGMFWASESEGQVAQMLRENVTPWLSAFSSLMRGVTISGSLVFIAHKLGGMRPYTERTKKDGSLSIRPVWQFWVGAVAGILLMILTGVLVPPYVYMLVTNTPTIGAVLGNWAAPWAVGVVLAADIAIVTVAVVDPASAGFAHMTESAPKPTAEVHITTGTAIGTASSAAKNAKSASKSDPEKEMLKCIEPGCGMMYAAKGGKGGHYKKHHAPIKVDQALLLKKDEPR